MPNIPIAVKRKRNRKYQKTTTSAHIHPNDTPSVFRYCIYLNTWNNPVLSIEILLVLKSYRCLRLPPSFSPNPILALPLHRCVAVRDVPLPVHV